MPCGRRKFVTLFTKASHSSLWRARRKQVILHMSFLQFCLILGCYLYLGLPSGLFSLASATQILCSFSPDTCYVTGLPHCSTHWRVQITSASISGLRNASDTFIHSSIVHPYCYICKTGPVQLYITKLQYMYKVSKTVTIIK